MKSKIWIYFLFLLSYNQIKSQTIEFNRPQITFIYSNTSNPKNQNIEEYLNYIINNKIKSSINEIADIRYPGENNSQPRDYLRYYDFYENQLPIFNQIENNMINKQDKCPLGINSLQSPNVFFVSHLPLGSGKMVTRVHVILIK